ncbi:MAG: polysaccharide deacetylase family protein [bacterium]
MKLLVSIHDVSPASEAAVLELWRLCRARDITPALLVVPNWHGQWPLSEYPAFVAWLHEASGLGAEVFLHGERHDERGSQRTFADRVRAFGVTDSEGEFLSLSRGEALCRMERGLKALRACGLEPAGFVPPAWLGPPGWSALVRACGLRFSEDAEFVHLHERATRLATPVTRWSARTRLRAALSASVADLRWRRDPHAPLMRVALHPNDLTSHDVRASIEQTLSRWLRRHHPWHYATL